MTNEGDNKPRWMSEHEQSDMEAFDRINERLAAIEEKLDDHTKRIEPYLQGAAGLGIIWKALIAIGGAVLLYAQIKQMFDGN